MKTAKSIQELAKEVDRQSKAKKDFTAPTNMIALQPNGRLRLGRETLSGKFEGSTLGQKTFFINSNCHAQIAARLKIPKQYYDRMLVDSLDLLANNVNHWFSNKPEKRMIRTLDGTARAFLSDRYRPLDNYDLLEAALPIISEQQCEVVSCEVTEQRMYIKVLFPRVFADVKVGDTVQAGLVLSNSEIGGGSLKTEILLYRLQCLNGMIGGHSMKKYHTGKRTAGEDDDIYEVLSDDTKRLTDAAFWARVKDVVKASFDQTHFNNEMVKLRAATEGLQMEPKHVPQIIEVVKSSFALNDAQGADIMGHLLSGGDFSKYGLANAITRTASDQESYDDATSLERLGGQVIELPQNDWKQIAQAA